ncbi:MAG TPA: glycosyltransferase [Saprospiraceae bacterium]|nr:glycosyltransferase [Saprospiraceae bacterium]HMQ85111.1 glycosyltransferase [Saprospiraceae bacterium]
MRNQQPIICIATPRWEGDYLKSTVQLMAELALHQPVLYVDYPFTWKDVLQGIQGHPHIPWRAVLGLSPRLTSVQASNGARIHLLRLPPFIPANWVQDAERYDRIMRWNTKWAARAIRFAMKSLAMADPIVINAFSPALGNFLKGQLDEKMLVYYCYDEISAASWLSRHGQRHEEILLKQADLTITSSTHLLESKKRFAQRCVCVKNGVDLSLFRPSAIKNPTTTKRPGQRYFGYIGSVDDRLDGELIRFLAQSLPSDQFIFVGRITSEPLANLLRQCPNVRLLGSKPTAELSHFISSFDAGLIPFVKNDLTAGIYPLKVNEYLALGKPVVATNFSDLSDFESIISIAPDAKTFLALLEKELTTDSADKAAERMRLAQKNSWSNRAAEFAAHLKSTWRELQYEPLYFT